MVCFDGLPQICIHWSGCRGQAPEGHPAGCLYVYELMTERQRILYWRKTQAKRNRFTKQMIREWKSVLMHQIQPVIDEISESTIRDMEARIPQLITSDLIEPQLERNTEIVGVYFARVSFNAVSKAAGPEMIHKMGGMPTDEHWLRQVMQYLKLTAGVRITAITDASKELAVKIIQATLQEGAAEGMGTSQISVLLRDNLNKQWGKFTTYRAARIARTETTMASNLGSLTGAKETGEPMLKVWLSARDSRTRRTTRGGKYEPGRYDHYGKFPMGPDGEKVEMDKPFVKTGESLQYPGDYSGSAGNTINCRCTVTYEPIIKDE